MVLKTLKDYVKKWRVGMSGYTFVRPEELRQEVEFWIKQAQEKLKKEKDNEKIWFAKGAIEVLKRFFNLEGMR
ncbi:hypothetical protein LCGC14_1706550 [marine sediment metagenome]|uniref:HEPN domain-containing protein n=1 Tax=marine sediment metagenome TaxID=412755 RepID=A0A0F9KGG3_9ZZZZ